MMSRGGRRLVESPASEFPITSESGKKNGNSLISKKSWTHSSTSCGRIQTPPLKLVFTTNPLPKSPQSTTFFLFRCQMMSRDLVLEFLGLEEHLAYEPRKVGFIRPPRFQPANGPREDAYTKTNNQLLLSVSLSRGLGSLQNSCALFCCKSIFDRFWERKERKKGILGFQIALE